MTQPEPLTLEISVNATSTKARVILGGVDITRYVTGFEVDAGVGKVTSARIDLTNVDLRSLDARDA